MIFLEQSKAFEYISTTTEVDLDFEKILSLLKEEYQGYHIFMRDVEDIDDCDVESFILDSIKGNRLVEYDYSLESTKDFNMVVKVIVLKTEE